jgi:hypothetical protein
MEMTVEGKLSSAMQILSRVYSGEAGGVIAMKVLKDQMEQQKELIAKLTQPAPQFQAQAYDDAGKSRYQGVRPLSLPV